MRKRKLLKVTLDLHGESRLTFILDKLQETLADLKHKHGEINGYEIKDYVMGADRRLRGG